MHFITLKREPEVIWPMNAEGGLYIELLAQRYITKEEIYNFCAPLARERGWNPDGRASSGYPTQHGIKALIYAVWFHEKLPQATCA